MKHKEIIKLFTQYEIEHPVGTYRCYDWNVWPLLRVSMSYDAVHPARRPFQFVDERLNTLLFQSRVFWRLKKIANKLRSRRYEKKILAIDPDSMQNLRERRRDIVILTLSGRRQRIGSCLYEIYSDSLIEYLEQMGVTTTTWERGEERWPRCRPSAWVSHELNSSLLNLGQADFIRRPSWFDDFAFFASTMLRRKVSWPEIKSKIQLTQQYSLIFEEWLKKTDAKMLISVCWYDPIVMAATLAASRLGLVSVDLQHGLQGSTHMAYSGWLNDSSGGYETVPDVFLSWGKESAAQTLNDNPAFSAQSSSIVLGNLWFNKWRDGNLDNTDSGLESLRKSTRKVTKVILISLQDGFGFGKFVFDAIQRSPKDWFWLVRFHPSMSTQSKIKIKAKLSNVTGSRVEVALSSTLPLYSVLRLTNIHLTGHSTTALEALGFGVPTITVTDTGAVVYKLYISEGVMQYASSAEELIRKIMLCENITSESCRNVADNIFAPANVVAEGIDRLLSVAGIKKGV